MKFVALAFSALAASQASAFAPAHSSAPASSALRMSSLAGSNSPYRRIPTMMPEEPQPEVDPRRRNPDDQPPAAPVRMPVIDTEGGQMDVISRLLKDRILLLGQGVLDVDERRLGEQRRRAGPFRLLHPAVVVAAAAATLALNGGGGGGG